ncbi:hypothetical protein [Methylobacterium dankookense]|uniref:Uncharacterized protein n=1 Tax=Methylobacterium dankookense TaxID=560405 RepID=A0A564G654_9HYPH|nr:hypothetical protein [Methylobacterium dankookense]GJD59444.1 hypothetical protein IFDJLNFL_5372 [Methylobacterium dankookense]VUF15817.1 hypothetical protein MTDSW087_05565 [Methylobacterium dankookense]
MHGQPQEVRPSEAERIALAYRVAAQGDAWAALVQAVEDALTDLAEAERRTLRRDRLISRGYIRAGAPRS